MVIGELADKMDNLEQLIISWFDYNMNMDREISDDAKPNFLRTNYNTEVKTIRVINNKVVAIINNPNR